KFNKFLQFDDVTSFTNYALTSAPGAEVLSGDEKGKRERAGSAWESSARSGSSAEGFQRSDREKSWRACGHANHACLWWRSYSGRAQHRRVADPFHLGRLDSRSELSHSFGSRKRGGPRRNLA